MLEVRETWSTANNIHSFIHSGYFCSASSSPLLLRGTPDTARILCRRFTPKRHRQLRVKNLLKVPTWWLVWDLNPQPSSRQVLTTNEPPCSTGNLLKVSKYIGLQRHPVSVKLNV